jgi:translocator protein
LCFFAFSTYNRVLTLEDFDGFKYQLCDKFDGEILVANGGSSLLRYANIIFFALTVVVNSLAGSTNIIGGRNTADVSNANSTLVTPAGYVFSIWGIIYILLGVFVVYQALPNEKGKDYQRKISWLFVLSSLVNIAWIFVWQFEYLSLSVLLIFVLLATLILIYLRLGVSKSKVKLREKLAVHLPFSVYLGWITVASIADVAATLVHYNWNGFGIIPQTWAILVVVVTLIITMLMLAIRKDIAFALVIIWALVGIGVNHSGNQTIVRLTEAGAVIVVIALIVMVLVTKLRKK